MNDLRIRIADEISDIVIGTGYYSTTIGINAALEAADALIAAGIVAEETDWEYGWKSHFPNGEEYEGSECKSRESAEETIRTLQEREDRAEDQIGGRLLYTLWKRTKERAGPWEPVEN